MECEVDDFTGAYLQTMTRCRMQPLDEADEEKMNIIGGEAHPEL